MVGTLKVTSHLQATPLCSIGNGTISGEQDAGEKTDVDVGSPKTGTTITELIRSPGPGEQLYWVTRNAGQMFSSNEWGALNLRNDSTGRSPQLRPDDLHLRREGGIASILQTSFDCGERHLVPVWC
ncbi:uncharacterized protein KD926_011319 [Aspergillus affinis]|uniref:uncharacterized protein n=1 Tax=Aspergillus affinis TaxID=1070780 RepID=UPI0022FF2AAF|nr:uncharacterized protein KD926_011319 [Aspergillus affinis]KAI9038081.1 hypothetical protein KD926_011319 [Aspergillus affinis]